MGLVDAVIVLAALLVATVIGGALTVWIRRRNEQRPRRDTTGDIVEPQRLGADVLGERATLLQFSTAMCARCPMVHRTLAQIADEREGVLHLDVDLTNRPDIARHFRVLQTPTTFVLDRDGTVQTRFGGTPGRTVIELELDRILEDAHV